MRALLRARTFGLTRRPAVRLRWAISKYAAADGAGALTDLLAEPPQRAREHAYAVGQ